MPHGTKQETEVERVTAAPSRKKTRRKNRAGTRRTIERAARDRHEAWTQTGVPVATTVYRLSNELDELFDDKRRGPGGASR